MTKDINEKLEAIEYMELKLPFNLEAEQSVIGAILIDANCINQVAQILPKPEYFYLANHKNIYSVILKMFILGEPIDYVTILNNFSSEDKKYKKDLKQYLLELAQIVPVISNIEYYAKIVKDKYEMRNLIFVIKNTLKDIYEESMEAKDILNVTEQKIFNIRKNKSTNGLQKINELVVKELDRLDKLNSNEGYKYKGLETGIEELDKTIMGLNKTDLILLAARPGMGKTSFALNIASNIAINTENSVAFFSLEMSKEQLVSRIIASQGHIPSKNIKTGDLSEEEWENLLKISDIISKSNMYIDDTSGIKIPEMKARLRRLEKVDLVIIDYLQLMTGTNKNQNRVQEISEITRELKIMAKELDVPVITLSQLSRASEQRAEHKPLLSDLRDSGSIEQDADIVLFLYRQGYYEDNYDNENIGECIIAKNRHGETKSIPLYWEGEYMKFSSVEQNIFA